MEGNFLRGKCLSWVFALSPESNYLFKKLAVHVLMALRNSLVYAVQAMQDKTGKFYKTIVPSPSSVRSTSRRTRVNVSEMAYPDPHIRRSSRNSDAGSTLVTSK